MGQPSTPLFVGIDVSKDALDVAFGHGGEGRRFTNDHAGHAALAEELVRAAPQRVLMEATGGYERAVLGHLVSAGLPALAVNPRQARRFAQSIGVLAKTDRIDAVVLARFAAVITAPQPRAPDQLVEVLGALVARRRQLTGMRTEELNRLRMASLPRVQKSIQRVIKTLEQQIADLDDEMDRTLRTSPHWSAVAEVLKSVPGIGDQTARTLIAEMPELGTLSRQRVAALAGLAPFNNDSGTVRGVRSIRGGRAPVRTALYMATLVATRYNPTVRGWYQTLLSRGKAKKVALVACMRKLLTALNSLVRLRRHWKEDALAA